MPDDIPPDDAPDIAQRAAFNDHDAAAAVARFARFLSHDLNNFTTVIRSYSELLLHGMPEGPQRSDVAEIYRAADSMARYVERVTRFTRTGSMRPAVYSLLPLVQSAISEFAEARDHAAVSLGAAVDANVTVDAHWCEDALREIVRNAREAAPASSVVTVTVALEEHATRPGVRVTVHDTGPGFTHDTVLRADQPYVSTKRGVRGAGFGLTVVQAFARSADGQLHHVREENITRVSLWLPTTS